MDQINGNNDFFVSVLFSNCVRRSVEKTYLSNSHVSLKILERFTQIKDYKESTYREMLGRPSISSQEIAES